MGETANLELIINEKLAKLWQKPVVLIQIWFYAEYLFPWALQNSFDVLINVMAEDSSCNFM